MGIFSERFSGKEHMDAKSVTDIFSGLLSMGPVLVPGLLPTWGKLILLGIPLCLYLATSMVPFIVLVGLVRASYGRRSLFERCSRQLGRLSNLLNWIFLICAAASIGYFAYVHQSLAGMHPILRLGLYGGCLCLLVGTLLWTLVMAGWKGLRNMPGVHGILTFLAGIFLIGLPAVVLIFGRAYLQGIPLPDVLTAGNLAMVFLPPLGGLFWISLFLLLGLEAAAAGCSGLVWLLLRRSRDDYGRDYYAFAAKWCGTWAAWGGWIGLACLAGLVCLVSPAIRTEAETVSANFFTMLLVVFLFIANVIWTGIARSTMPMRHKIGMVLSACLLVACMASGGMLLL